MCVPHRTHNYIWENTISLQWYFPGTIFHLVTQARRWGMSVCLRACVSVCERSSSRKPFDHLSGAHMHQSASTHFDFHYASLNECVIDIIVRKSRRVSGHRAPVPAVAAAAGAAAAALQPHTPAQGGVWRGGGGGK